MLLAEGKKFPLFVDVFIREYRHDRGSEEVLGSPHNGFFWQKELQDRIKIATEVEKENLQQLKGAKIFFYLHSRYVTS